MYDIIPDLRKVLGCGIVLGILLALAAWGLYELLSAIIDVSISFHA